MKTANANTPNKFEQLKLNFTLALHNVQKLNDPIFKARHTPKELYNFRKVYEKALQALSIAIAYSVLNKCIDPQRKTAKDYSNSGCNPALLDLRRGIAKDIASLEKIDYCAERATKTAYNSDGDYVTEIIDKGAYEALTKLMTETLTDGIDLVQTATLAILEEVEKAKERFTDGILPENWLDTPYTVRRLSKKVYIQLTDSKAYKDVETTPIQEVYRAVRKAVQDSRAVQTDPANGYTYIEELTADGLETILYRLGKYTDLGGYDCNGNYTTGAQNVADYETMIEKLNLTERQAGIIKLRMQGKGYKAIATYYGVDTKAVHNALHKVQAKCAKLGYNCDKYKDK